jgi:hypothetical protein
MIKRGIIKLLSKLKTLIFILLRAVKILKRSKVNTFIVGTQKGGTTSLFNFLEYSSEVTGSYNKEIGYFSRIKIYNKGKVWYENRFCYNKSKGLKLVDATPEYLYYPEVPEKIFKYNKAAKIIILLREPISRAFSHYSMFKKFNQAPKKSKKRLYNDFFKNNLQISSPLWDLVNAKEFPVFSDIIENEISLNSQDLEPSFIKRGLYYEQVERYLKIFPKENVLILESNELKNNKKQSLLKVCNFLKISNVFLKNQDFKNSHIGTYQSKKMDDNTKIKLKEYYKLPNNKLFSLIGKKYNWND